MRTTNSSALTWTSEIGFHAEKTGVVFPHDWLFDRQNNQKMFLTTLRSDFILIVNTAAPLSYFKGIGK